MDMLSAALAFIDGLGAPEMLLIFVLVLVLFGGNKLPEFARGLGKTMREFKKAASGVEEEFRRALEEDERKQNAAKYEPPPALPPGSTDATATTPDPAGPGNSSHNYHDEYGHEYYENQDGTTDTAAPANTGTDPLKTTAPGSADAAAPAATPPSPPSTDPAGPAAAPVPPPAATSTPPPPPGGGQPPSSTPPGPAATP